MKYTLLFVSLVAALPLDYTPAPQLEAFDVTKAATTPFPDWLKAFTGLTEWPGPDPPYIPLDFIDFNSIPNYPARADGACPTTRDSCSFDCYKCVSFDDVYTCPKLSQSFDDGPSAFTEKLTNGLDHPVTFFTLGMNVVRYPEVYQSSMRKGHLMATHTWSHKFLPSLTNEQLIAQFEWSVWAQNATGHHLPKWYRPPYGGIDDRVRSIARFFGMQAVVWDKDLFDWKLQTTPPTNTREKILADAQRYKTEGKGGLMLEHDAYQSTVDVALEVSKVVGSDQWTVAQCVDSIKYIREF